MRTSSPDPTARGRVDRVAYGEGRSLIVRAAITVVAEEGLSRMTYRAIAARAGVAHATVQHHFASLDDVLREALETCLAVGLPPLRTVVSPAGFVEAILELVAADPAMHSFQYELILESRRRPSLQPLVDQLYAEYWSTMALALRSMGLEADDGTVRAVFAAIDGLVFQLVTVAADDPAGSAATRDGVIEVIARLARQTSSPAE